jgi:hypothetical protein
MKKTTVATPAAYLKALSADQRETIAGMRRLILKHLPQGYKEAVNWGALTYEVPLTRLPDTYNKQPLCYVAIAAQKRFCSLYLMTTYGDAGKKKQLEDAFLQSGKRLDMGKACIHFRTLDDLPLPAIANIVASTPVDAYVAAYEKSRERRTHRK